MDEVRKLARIADKKDGGVVAHHVPVPLLCVELDSETSGIPCGVCATLFAADCRETCKNGSLLADLTKERGLRILCDIMSNLENPVSTRTFGMDDALRNALTIKMSKLVDEVKILEQDRTVGTSSLRGLIFRDGHGIPVTGGKSGRGHIVRDI